MATPSSPSSPRSFSAIPPPSPQIEGFWGKFKAFLSNIVSYIPLIGSYLTQAQKSGATQPLLQGRLSTEETHSDKKVREAAAIIKPPITREVIVEKLAAATGFEKNLFYTLTDTEIEKLKPVYRELADAKKTSADIKKSRTGEKLTFAKFSRRVFTSLKGSFLRPGYSLSLYIAPETNKLQLFEDRRKVLGKGGFKQAKLAQGELKDYVRGTFLEDLPDNVREGIITTQLKAYTALREKVNLEQRKYLCLPEVVTYKSEKTETTKRILLAPYMNLRDVARVGYKIPAGQSVSVMLQIAKGLQALHDSGYAHLDIHGGNILLHREANGSYVAKLTDFDVIKDTSSTQSLECIWVPPFERFPGIAPELLNYNPFPNIKKFVPYSDLKMTDIYSLGYVFSQFFYAGSYPPTYKTQFIKLVNDMTQSDPKARPTIDNVIKRLKDFSPSPQ